jgi:hypothetical protein
VTASDESTRNDRRTSRAGTARYRTVAHPKQTVPVSEQYRRPKGRTSRTRCSSGGRTASATSASRSTSSATRCS